MDLDLDDLSFPATIRGIRTDGSPGDYVEVNQAFLDFYSMAESPRSPADFMGERAVGPDEMDRRVADGAEPVTYNLPFRGRMLALQKSPVTRDGRVVAVLTVLTDTVDIGDAGEDPANTAHLGRLTDSSLEGITLLEFTGDEARIVSQNRASLNFDRMIDGATALQAQQIRGDLFRFAQRAVDSGTPEVHELAVGDRHYRVRTEVIDDSGDPSRLLTQTVVDVSDVWRARWLEQLVAVASMPTVATAAKLTFDVVNESLDLDRGALLRFDGHMVDVFGTTSNVEVDRRLHVSDGVLALASTLTATVMSVEDEPDDPLLGSLGIEEGVAVPLHVDGDPWGLLVLGSSEPSGWTPTPLIRSMLDALGATLSMLIERDRGRQRLQESNRRLEEYAHAAAHDLRSPLRRIRSFAQILQARLGVEDLDREQLSDFAERIARGAARLDTLLESMLEHANISALAEESTEFTDLQEVAESICQGIVELSQDPKPSFRITGLPEVRLPRDAAERVLRNLIDNSLKYAAKDRPAVVELTGEAYESGVRVRVHDNGIGIEPQFADKVFQLFNQLSNDTSGSGVGLAVVERLLSTRGAKIWVESEVGRGATFVIEFPSDVLRSSRPI